MSMNIQKFRPQNFAEFIGKKSIINNLKIFVSSANKTGNIIDHILFYGVPGVGKTSLATIVANELNAKIHYFQGSLIKKASDLLNIFSMINENDVVFIDEIHSIDQNCIELLYLLMEDYVIDLQVGKDFNSKSVRMKTPKFCLIGSTNNLYKLPNPLIDRFGIQFFINEYTKEEIAEILTSVCNWNGFVLNSEDIKIIASVSKGVPRIGINILKRFLDHHITKTNLTPKEILKTLGIYECGLSEMDIKYLNFLRTKKVLGLKTITQFLGVDFQTVEFKIEPFLLKNEFITKEIRGRKLTEKGLFIIEKINKIKK